LFYAKTAAPAVPKKQPPRTQPKRAVPQTNPQSSDASVVVQVLPATYGNRKPLGLRYAFLRSADNDFREVAPDTVFRSGDRIRVAVESNDEGYLYVVLKGTSGTWKLLFPNPEIAGGSNKVQGGAQQTIPPAPGRFAFDEQAGEERLFLVLTRRPEESLEKLIYSLGSGSAKEMPVMMAKNTPPISDSMVGQLRLTVTSRDLIFEKVDESTPGTKKENAVYVVNQTGDSDSRLVVDVTLKHR
jgi:hypothetical protein